MAVAATVLFASASVALAESRYAVVISGASGGPQYAENYTRWRGELVQVLRGEMQFAPDNLIELGEEGTSLTSSRENIRRVLADVRAKMAKDDLLLLVLIGHGTFDGTDAKFNLVGPDLEANEWKSLLRGFPGRLVVVNASAASFPFLARLSGPGRVILTATDSGAQAYETVFPDFFVKSLADPAGDLDKNGRISILEAFTYASMRVRQWYEQKGQLSTERPLLDDNGDGIGKEAGAPGPDGAVAARLFLDAGSAASMTADPELADLMRRRAELEAAVENLKSRKPMMRPDEYQDELERVRIELARVSQAIRSRT